VLGLRPGIKSPHQLLLRLPVAIELRNKDDLINIGIHESATAGTGLDARRKHSLLSVFWGNTSASCPAEAAMKSRDLRDSSDWFNGSSNVRHRNPQGCMQTGRLLQGMLTSSNLRSASNRAEGERVETDCCTIFPPFVNITLVRQNYLHVVIRFKQSGIWLP
jgi:hypothetical protein